MEFVIMFMLSVVVAVSSEAVWSEWKPLGQCSAKPCNCDPEREDNTCDKANMTMEDRLCSYDDHGPIKLGKCENNKRNCPGWSDWLYKPCNCDPTDPERFQSRLRWKECNNPPPMYKDLKCAPQNETDTNGELLIIVEEEEGSLKSKLLWYKDVEACPCNEPTTTTTTTTTTITPMDCSHKNDDGDFYADGYGDDNLDDGNEGKEEDPCDYYYNYRK